MTPSSEISAAIDDAIAESRHLDGACLPILHGIQHRLGYVPADAIPRIAQALNLSRAEVHGVVTFYKDFRTTPPGRHMVRLCRAESCQAVGGDLLADRVRDHLGVDFGETTADGAVTLDAIYCFGNCALSPAAMLDDRLQGRVNAEGLCADLDRLREAAE